MCSSMVLTGHPPFISLAGGCTSSSSIKWMSGIAPPPSRLRQSAKPESAQVRTTTGKVPAPRVCTVNDVNKAQDQGGASRAMLDGGM